MPSLDKIARSTLRLRINASEAVRNGKSYPPAAEAMEDLLDARNLALEFNSIDEQDEALMRKLDEEISRLGRFIHPAW